MKTYIKNFKSIWISLIIILLIEFIIIMTTPKELLEMKIYDQMFIDSLFDRTNSEKLRTTRISYFLFRKQKEINFIQIGDSSGLHGVRPAITNDYLSGLKYFNMSCCAPQGWDGHLALAECYTKEFAKINNPFYIVLYFNIYSPPGIISFFNKKLPETLTKVSSWKNFVPQKLSSLSYRYKIFHAINYSNIYYGMNYEKIYRISKQNLKTTDIPREMIDSEKHNPYFIESKKLHLGWSPYFEKPERKRYMPRGNTCWSNYIEKSVKTCRYEKKGLKIYLEKIKEVVERNGGKLIVIVNPVSCSDGSGQLQFLADQFEEFRNENPDVIVPFDFITTWSENDFSDQWHLTPEASIKNSHRIGKALAKKIFSRK